VPAFSSALSSSIFRLPRSPPVALISSAASCWPLNIGSPSTAAGPVKNVMCPILNGFSGVLPFGFSVASAAPAVGIAPAARGVPDADPGNGAAGGGERRGDTDTEGVQESATIHLTVHVVPPLGWMPPSL